MYHVPHNNPMRRQWLLWSLAAGWAERLRAMLSHADASDTLRLGPDAVLTRADVRRQHRGYFLVRLVFTELAGRPLQDMSDFLGPLATLPVYHRFELPAAPPRARRRRDQKPDPAADERRFRALLDALANSPDHATGTVIMARPDRGGGAPPAGNAPAPPAARAEAAGT